MKHLCLNLKRFDVPAAMGGVNRLAWGNSWSKTIVSRVRDELEQYRGAARFPMYFPEAHVITGFPGMCCLFPLHKLLYLLNIYV